MKDTLGRIDLPITPFPAKEMIKFDSAAIVGEIQKMIQSEVESAVIAYVDNICSGVLRDIEPLRDKINIEFYKSLRDMLIKISKETTCQK